MKETQNNTEALVAIGVILLIGIVVFFGVANATTLSWTKPTSRVDNKPLPANEISGYKIYLNDKWNNILLKSNVLTTDIDLPVGKNFLNITTVDTGGRESKYSNTVYKTIVAADIVLPLAPELSISRVDNSLTYQFSFPEVSVDVKGNPITVTKYYLFKDNKWIKDVRFTDLPLTYTLPIGTYEYSMETEAVGIDGVTRTSERSTVVALTVDEYVAPPVILVPPMPPVFINIPEGATSVGVTFK